jgi:hypothetical protein
MVTAILLPALLDVPVIVPVAPVANQLDELFGTAICMLGEPATRVLLLSALRTRLRG